MRKILMVVLVAFISLPVFAQQKKPTPPAVAKKQSEVKPTPAPAENISPDSSRSDKSTSDADADRIFCGDHTDTPRCCRHNGGYWVSLGAGDPGGCNFYYYYYRVRQVNAKDNSFTAMGKGNEVTFSALKLQALPKVGDIIDITYTRSARGALEARAVKLLKSSNLGEGEVRLTPAPPAKATTVIPTCPSGYVLAASIRLRACPPGENRQYKADSLLNTNACVSLNCFPKS